MKITGSLGVVGDLPRPADGLAWLLRVVEYASEGRDRIATHEAERIDLAIPAGSTRDARVAEVFEILRAIAWQLEQEAAAVARSSSAHLADHALPTACPGIGVSEDESPAGLISWLLQVVDRSTCGRVITVATDAAVVRCALTGAPDAHSRLRRCAAFHERIAWEFAARVDPVPDAQEGPVDEP